MTMEQADRTAGVPVGSSPSGVAAGVLADIVRGTIANPPAQGLGGENTVLSGLLRTRGLLQSSLTVLDELQGLNGGPEATQSAGEPGIIELTTQCEILAEQLRDRTQVVRANIGRL